MTKEDCDPMSEQNCDDALNNLYTYLDREADEATSAGIRSHLDDCGHCAQSFDFERRLKQVVRDRLAEEVPQEFIARLRAAIAKEGSTR